MSIENWVMMITTIVTVASGYAMLSRSLRKDFDKRFDAIDSRFDENDRRFERIDKQFERIDSRFDENDDHFSTLEATLARMDDKFTAQFIGVNTRIDQVNGRIDDALRVNNR